ncbi:hypothetical protein [Arcticibacter eurypsychrophilus]|uniref:hypothetical protein n=1 Tax=Arcticibacter eurypsychrophilus TaxID=1434752 RepID=UPI00084D8694|nr:hypothetical protein [Arcticibacter eurypsychrophilus]
MKNSLLSGLLLSFVIIFTTNCNVHSQSSKEITFIALLKNLSIVDALKDYKDRSALTNDFRNKLIISDLKETPILNKLVEENDFIVASYAKIVKSNPDFYVLPQKLVITSKLAYVEFDIINKYKLKLSGKYTLFNDDPNNTNGAITSGARSEFTISKQD